MFQIKPKSYKQKKTKSEFPTFRYVYSDISWKEKCKAGYTCLVLGYQVAVCEIGSQVEPVWEQPAWKYVQAYTEDYLLRLIQFFTKWRFENPEFRSECSKW